MSVVVNVIRGILMGIAEVIPGVSGGTVALIVGVYRSLIEAIADAVAAVRGLVGRGPGRWSRAVGRLRSLPWGLLIPLGLGMVTAVLLGARLIEPLLETHPVQMRAIFFGLVVAGAYVPLRMVLSTGPLRLGDVVLMLIAAGAAFALTGLPPGQVDNPGYLAVFFSAAAAICALVIPGVSGSFLLLSLGMYEPTISAVNDRDVVYILVFAAGAIVGLALFVTLLRWLLEHRSRVTLTVVTGLMIGSLRALWPWQTEDRGLLAPSGDVLVVVVLALAGAAFVAGLLWLEHRLGLSEQDVDPPTPARA